MGRNQNLVASATMCLVNCRRLGKAKNVDRQNLWVKEASKSGRLVTKVGTGVNPADLMTQPMPRSKVEQLMNIMCYEFINENREKSVEVSISENMMVFADRRTCRWIQGGIGGLRDPVTNSLEYKLCK